jgi:Caspase domain/WD domain, G-beta repeat
LIVIELRSSWRFCLAASSAVGLAAIVNLAPGRAAGLDPAQMRADEIKTLEQRLTDAGCYKGAIDGAASAALDDAIKACPDQQPMLRIEAGMHVLPISSVGVDAACQLLATASDDKTVRLWSLPNGELKKVVRLPIGDGDAGKVYATALSPDGRWLAAGGWDAEYGKTGKSRLSVVELSNGAIRRFGAFEDFVLNIAFSPDGRRIAVGLWEKGVRVLDSATGAELMADRDYGDNVLGLAFATDGALITSSHDGQLRRYKSDLKLPPLKRTAPDGKLPYSVAIDPSGRRVAGGYLDQTQVSILDATTLARLAKAETNDLGKGDLSAVAWSREGATLVAGGRAQEQFGGEVRQFLRRFDAAGLRVGADTNVSSHTIFDVQPCGEGFAFATGDPSFGLLSAQGAATVLETPRTTDMRDKLGSAFAISSDASSVRFGLGYGEEKPVVFDLAAASLTDSPSLPPGLVPARADGLPVTDWKDSDQPKFDGKRLALGETERSRSLAIRPSASGFVLGASYSIGAYNATGKQRWNQPGPGEAWGVDFSADGEIIAIAYGDGTIRWLRWKDGEELLALFVEPESRKWVAWTPSGYYMASAGGEDLIGWHVNRGWDQASDFFPASQLRADYSRPDIVRLVLQTKDEAEAIRQANAKTERTAPAKPIAAALPPVVTITSPEDGFHPHGTLVQIGYSLRSPSLLPVDRLDVLADGRPVEAVGFEKTSGAEAKGRVVAEVPKISASLSLIAYSGGLTSAPVTIKFARDRPIAWPPNAPDLRPKLYAQLVGVTGYENPDYKLQFPAQDAVSVAKALDAQKGGLFGDVQTKVVADANQHSVFEGLDWLRQATTSGDLAVVFLAGHGFVDPKKRFWFLTREADTGRLRTTAVSNDDLFDSIASIPGKKVLFIDACYAAAALTWGDRALETTPDMNKLVNDFSTAGSGIVVYASSTGTEFSKEDPTLSHGAFSEALIEAIGEGKAPADNEGRITIVTLENYLDDRVKELTKGQQHPIMNRPQPVPDFPIALPHR